jgi:hypothetical protein
VWVSNTQVFLPNAPAKWAVELSTVITKSQQAMLAAKPSKSEK